MGTSMRACLSQESLDFYNAVFSLWRLYTHIHISTHRHCAGNHLILEYTATHFNAQWHDTPQDYTITNFNMEVRYSSKAIRAAQNNTATHFNVQWTTPLKTIRSLTLMWRHKNQGYPGWHDTPQNYMIINCHENLWATQPGQCSHSPRGGSVATWRHNTHPRISRVARHPAIWPLALTCSGMTLRKTIRSLPAMRTRG